MEKLINDNVPRKDKVSKKVKLIMSEATTENRMKVKSVWMIEKTLKERTKWKDLKERTKTKKNVRKRLMNNQSMRKRTHE